MPGVNLGLSHICVYTPIYTLKHIHTSHIEKDTEREREKEREKERERAVY